MFDPGQNLIVISEKIFLSRYEKYPVFPGEYKAKNPDLKMIAVELASCPVLSEGRAAPFASAEIVKRPETEGKHIVTIFADGASRYFSTDVFIGFDAD